MEWEVVPEAEEWEVMPSRWDLNLREGWRTSMPGQTQSYFESGEPYFEDIDKLNKIQSWSDSLGIPLPESFKAHIEKQKKRAEEIGGKKREEWQVMRAGEKEEYAQSKSFWEEDGITDQILGFFEALGGQLVGGALDPMNAIGVSRGMPMLKTLLTGAAGGLGGNLMTDVSSQTQDINYGVQDQFDPMQSLISAGVGAVAGGTLAGAGRALDMRGERIKAQQAELEVQAKAAEAEKAAQMKAQIEAMIRAGMDPNYNQQAPEMSPLTIPDGGPQMSLPGMEMSPTPKWNGLNLQQDPATSLTQLPDVLENNIPYNVELSRQVQADEQAASGQQSLFNPQTDAPVIPPTRELGQDLSPAIIEQQNAQAAASKLDSLDQKVQGLMQQIPNTPAAPNTTRFDPNSKYGAETSSGLFDPDLYYKTSKNDFGGVIGNLANSQQLTPIQRKVAQQLAKKNLKDVGIFRDPNMGGRIGGTYDPVTNVVTMGKDAGDPQVTLHEAIHTVTAHQIGQKIPAAKPIIDLFEVVRNYHAKAAFNGQQNNFSAYGFKNADEFVAEALSNPEFQKTLQDTPLTRAQANKIQGSGKLKTLWDVFVDSIRRMFGLSPRETEALSIALEEGAKLINTSSVNMRNQFMDSFGAGVIKPLNHISPYGNGQPINNPPNNNKQTNTKAVKSVKGDTLFDRRTADELVKDIDWGKLEDIKLPNTQANVLQGYNVATVNRNPLIKWFNSQILKIDRENKIKVQNAKYGDTYVQGTRWEHHKPDNTGALTFLDRNKKSASGERVKDALIQFDRDGKEPTATDLTAYTPAERQAILSVRKRIKDFAEEFNAAAQEMGFSPINVREGYIPHMRIGDYMVYVRDGKDTIRAYGAKNEKEAQTLMADLQTQFPNMTVDARPRKSEYDLNDVTAFREAMGLFSKQSPQYKALDSAYKQIVAHRGFAKSTLFRKGIEGFLGENSAKDMHDALDMYLTRGYRFLSNQKKHKALQDLEASVKKAEQEIPKNTKTYLDTYRDNAVGAIKDQLPLLKNAVEAMGSALGKYGLGNSDSGRKLLGNVNGVASVLWLGRIAFAVTQLVQPLMNLPKMVAIKQDLNLNQSVAKAFFDAYMDLLPRKLPAETVEAMNYAKKHGFIDSKIIDLMNTHTVSNPGDVAKGLGNVVKWSLGKLEQEAVRTPTFLMYDKLLKQAVPDKEARWQLAGELSDAYMVNYSRSERPAMYGKMGMLGESAAPLKQFAHAYYGQALEYMTRLKGGDLKTFASFVGVQVLMSGAKGMLLAAEANILINLINAVAGTSIPTIEEYLIENDFGDWAVFGGISAFTGMDISASIAAPTLEGFASLPGVGFSADVVGSFATYVTKLLKGTATEADEFAAIQSITPLQAMGLLEDAYTEEGKGPPNPRNRMIQNTPARTSEERLVRNLTGARATSESRQLMGQRLVTREGAKVRKKKEELVSAMIDRVEKGEEFSSLMTRYTDLDGDPNQAVNQIVKHMIDKNMDFATRYLGKVPSAEKAKRLERFNQLLQDKSPEELGDILQELKGRENGRNQ